MEIVKYPFLFFGTFAIMSRIFRVRSTDAL